MGGVILSFVAFLASCLMVGGYVYEAIKSDVPNSAKSEVALFATGRTFLIRNKKSSMYMTDVSVSTPAAPVKQFPIKTGDERANQVWILTPSEKGGYLIANKKTGKFFVEVTKPKVAGTVELGIPISYSDPSETWEISPTSTGTPERFYSIRSKLTQWILLIEAYGTTAGGIVSHFPSDQMTDFDSYQWAFEVEEDPTKVVTRTVNDIGDVGGASVSSEQARPFKTDDVLIGQLLLPFTVVADPSLTKSQQSNLSPFYYLRRYGYWQVVAFHDHGDAFDVVTPINIDLGLITNNAKTMETITGLCVTSSSSLCLTSSRLLFMIAEIANSLKINVDEDVSVISSKPTTLELRHTNRQIDVVWIRQDRYELMRMNGVKVLDWITQSPKTISRSWLQCAPPMAKN